MIEISVNGDCRSIDGSMTISAFLQMFELNERMVVVEHNGEIVPRANYAQTTIDSGDNLEIVQMMAGG